VPSAINPTTEPEFVLLQDAGTVAGNVVSGEWSVVPCSGTGGLAGLRGTDGFRANLGERAEIRLDYWFE
jgi:hypothetical protein